jgi:hypothetical protein
MSQSLLLQIARDSIAEVLEAQHRIDKDSLFKQYPLLKEPLAAFVSIYLDNELRGSMGTITPSRSLLEEIIHNAKAAAFEDSRFSPLKTSEYLHCSIELSLLVEPKALTYSNIDDLRRQITQGEEGLFLAKNGVKAGFLPLVWSESSSFEEFLAAVLGKTGPGDIAPMQNFPQLFSFRIEKERDTPILP